MYGRRDVNGKANAGLTLGIIGTALGAWALFGNRRSAGVLGTGAGLMGDGSTNINVVGVWDLIDSEIEPLTAEQRNMLASNEEYVNNYNSLQNMVQAEVLNLVRAKIEGSPEGKALLDNQLKLVKNLKTSISTN